MLLPLLTASLVVRSPRCQPPHMVVRSPRCQPWPRMAMSFEDAVASAPELCAALQRDESPDGLKPFVASSAGARGFFVSWLTADDWTRADAEAPPQALMAALADSPQEVADVMVMNVIMSTATAVAHSRAGRTEEAEMSERTAARALVLVRALRPTLAPLDAALSALQAALSDQSARPKGVDAEMEDAWIIFLQRWMYDDAQLDRVCEALAQCDT